MKKILNRWSSDLWLQFLITFRKRLFQAIYIKLWFVFLYKMIHNYINLIISLLLTVFLTKIILIFIVKSDVLFQYILNCRGY